MWYDPEDSLSFELEVQTGASEHVVCHDLGETAFEVDIAAGVVSVEDVLAVDGTYCFHHMLGSDLVHTGVLEILKVALVHQVLVWDQARTLHQAELVHLVQTEDCLEDDPAFLYRTQLEDMPVVARMLLVVPLFAWEARRRKIYSPYLFHNNWLSFDGRYLGAK